MGNGEIDFDYCYNQGWIIERDDIRVEWEREDCEFEEQWLAYLMGAEDYRESVR